MFLRYELVNTEPLRIADNSKSQMGQTSTLHYIPGSAIRGSVIGELIRKGRFEEVKGQVLGGVSFLNAYPMEADSGRELLPAFRGFYEDKTRVMLKQIRNVVKAGDFEDGWKRASLGDFVSYDGDVIQGYTVPTGSDLKIKIQDNVFRNEYMKEGLRFAGYIGCESEELAALMLDILAPDGRAGSLILGNGRSSGMGKCQVIRAAVIDTFPFASYADTGDAQKEAYMLLLSDTVMRDASGEYCGLDLEALDRALHVKIRPVRFAATSVRNVCGYNRTWGTHIPSVIMYEKGSVFHLEFDGVMEGAVKEKLMRQGIGVRRNEGFGRVLFLKDYEKLTKKKAVRELSSGTGSLNSMVNTAGHTVSASVLSGTVTGTGISAGENSRLLRQTAKRYYQLRIRQAAQNYVVNRSLAKGRMSASRLGVVEGILEKNQYRPETARKRLQEYFQHDLEKADNLNRQQSRVGSSATMAAHVREVFEEDLPALLDFSCGDSIMGIPRKDLLDEAEEGRIRVQILLDEIRYDNKKRS